MENKYWKETVAALITGIWVYTVAGIVGDIFGLINSASSVGDVMSMMNGGSASVGFGFIDFIELLCSVLVIAGYYFFFRSLLRFIKMQRNEADQVSANKIKTSYILLICSIVTGWIPIIGWIASIVLLILSYVQQLSGYKGLSESTVLPKDAKQGAAKIRSAVLWMLIGSIIAIIPLVGGIAAAIITIVMFFKILSGWALIRQGAPDITIEEAAAYDAENAEPKSQLDIWWNALAQKIVK